MFTFNEKTSKEVQAAIIKAYNRGDRVRIWYGDVTTGKSWLEEYGVMGKIGRSMGPKQIPLLIKNSRSIGGGALLDSSIIRIDSITQRYTLYKHPSFNAGNLVEVVPTGPEWLEAVARDNGDETIAQFKKPGQAAKWNSFNHSDIATFS